MLAVNDQSTLLGITGHMSGILHWMSLVNVWKLSDNRAVDLIHVERQTQHVRHNILYRLYFHYFLEQIKYRLMTSIVNQY